MRDLDSAVGRLDNILMSVYVVVAILIIAVALVSMFLATCIIIPSLPAFRKRNWLPSSLVPAVFSSVSRYSISSFFTFP